MVEHFLHQMHSEFEMSLVGSLAYYFGLQVKQLRDILSKALHVVQFENLRGVIDICMSETLKQFIQGKRARIKGKFIFLMIIEARKIRGIYSNSIYFIATYPSHTKTTYHSLYCSSTYVHPHLSRIPQTSSKIIPKANEAKSSEPKLVSNSYGVKLLGVKVGIKSPTKKCRVSRSNIMLMNLMLFITLYHCKWLFQLTFKQPKIKECCHQEEEII